MPTLKAQIPTERASRYLTQLCKHATAMGSGGHRARMHGGTADREVQVAADWSDSTGTISFTPWGVCTLSADAHTLAVRIDAADHQGLSRIRDVITADLQRFSGRAPLTVTWQEAEDAEAAPAAPDATNTTTRRRPGVHRPRLQTVVLGFAAVLVVAAHIGLAGTVVAKSPWTGIAGNLLLVAIAAKLAVVAWTYHRARRRKTTETRSRA